MKKSRIIKTLLFLVCVGLFVSCNQHPKHLNDDDVKCAVYNKAVWFEKYNNYKDTLSVEEKIPNVSAVEFKLIQSEKASKRYVVIYDVSLPNGYNEGRHDFYILADITEWGDNRWDMLVEYGSEEISRLMGTYAHYGHE